ncbi:hypothetical protein ACHBTE_07970 [Streptomyces sp. M41]|uniref:hypothetical protein n=1 Tax=Streptomyces sp. M41 TaxID=3059412 RepID=UPI00374DABBC
MLHLLLCLLPLLLRAEGLPHLLEQLLERLLLPELLELLQRATHAVRLLLADVLQTAPLLAHALLAEALRSVALLLPERLLLPEGLLLVRRRAGELLALLLSHVTHLRGGAHSGVTFP